MGQNIHTGAGGSLLWNSTGDEALVVVKLLIVSQAR